MSETNHSTVGHCAARLFGMAAVVALLPVLASGQEPQAPRLAWVLDLSGEVPAQKLGATADGGFLLISHEGNLAASSFVSRRGPEGQEIWRLQVDFTPTRAATLSTGDFVLYGYRRLDGGQGFRTEARWAEVSATGELVWSGIYRLPGATITGGESGHLAVLPEGGYLLSGHSDNRSGFVARFPSRSSEPTWVFRTTHGVRFAVPNADGGILVYASGSATNNLCCESLIGLDADGREEWRHPGFRWYMDQRVSVALSNGGFVSILRPNEGERPRLYRIGTVAADGTMQSVPLDSPIEARRLVAVGGRDVWLWASDENGPVLVHIGGEPPGSRQQEYRFPGGDSGYARDATVTTEGLMIVLLGGDRLVAWQLPGVTFRRGDTNADGNVDLADAVTTLLGLFQGGPAPACADGADADDDGRLTLTDPIATLNWLFLAGPALPAPGAECGSDPTGDDLPHCSAACAP